MHDGENHTRLQSQISRLKRLTAALAACIVALLCIAADQAVRGKLTILDPNNKDRETIRLTSGGDVELLHGALKVQGIDVLAEIKALRKQLLESESNKKAPPGVGAEDLKPLVRADRIRVSGPWNMQLEAGGATDSRRNSAGFPVLGETYSLIFNDARAKPTEHRFGKRVLAVFHVPENIGAFHNLFDPTVARIEPANGNQVRLTFRPTNRGLARLHMIVIYED